MGDGSAIDRERTCYEQNFQQFRSLNQIMWQVPVIAMTLTGGLWFGAANVHEIPAFQYALLALAAVSNLGLAVVLTRIRYVMEQYEEKIRGFYEAGYVAAEGTRTTARNVVMRTFRCLLILSAIISLFAVWSVWASASSRPQTERVIKVIELE